MKKIFIVLASITVFTLGFNTQAEAHEAQISNYYIEVVPHSIQVRVSVDRTTTRTINGALSTVALRGATFVTTSRTQNFGTNHLYIEIANTPSNGVFRGLWVRISHTQELPGQGI